MGRELALLGEVLRLDPELDAADLIAALSRSDAAADVVRLANSSLYGGEGRVSSLAEAARDLPRGALGGVAATALVAREVRPLRIGPLSGEDLWLHALTIGIAADLCARCLYAPVGPTALLAGLIHDLGVVELHRAHGGRYEALLVRAARDKRPLVEIEQQELGETHAERMRARALEWGFPGTVCEVVRWHDEPLRAPAEARAPAALLHAAHIIAGGQLSPWTDVPHSVAHDRFLRELGLDGDDISDIVCLLAVRVKECAQILGAAA
jgi:HD-like signal output (HDOD) protein